MQHYPVWAPSLFNPTIRSDETEQQPTQVAALETEF